MFVRRRFALLNFGEALNFLLKSLISRKFVVGPARLELATPRLSSVCSNQLSYEPVIKIRTDS